MSSYKIKICDYFDALINRLDLVVETAIIDNNHDQKLIDQLNHMRNVLLNEIRYIQAYNLRALSDLNTNQEDAELTNEDLFPKFCFFVELPETSCERAYSYMDLVGSEISLRLIVLDKYLTEAQIKRYKSVFLNQISRWNHIDVQLLFNLTGKHVII
jgi:hypothetical protein